MFRSSRPWMRTPIGDLSGQGRCWRQPGLVWAMAGSGRDGAPGHRTVHTGCQVPGSPGTRRLGAGRVPLVVGA